MAKLKIIAAIKTGTEKRINNKIVNVKENIL